MGKRKAPDADERSLAARFLDPGVLSWTTKEAYEPIMEAIGTRHEMITPLIGKKEDISALGSMLPAESQILGDYSAFRQVQQDYNSLYRAFAFLYMEYILEAQDRTKGHVLLHAIEECKGVLDSLEYDKFTYAPFLRVLTEQLQIVMQVPNDLRSSEDLFQRFSNPLLSDQLVMAFRFLTSAALQRAKPYDANTCMTTDRLCKTLVEPMWQGARTKMQLRALTTVLKLHTVVHNPTFTGALKVRHHNEFKEGFELTKPDIHLMYLAGHYTILYPK